MLPFSRLDVVMSESGGPLVTWPEKTAQGDQRACPDGGTEWGQSAPAMARATLGITMGAVGSDAAFEAADIALMSDDLRNSRG